MKRKSLKIKIGENKYRHRSIIEDEPSTEYSESSIYRQRLFLKSLTDTPDLLLCGLVPFQRFKMYHNGDCWVAELEAEGDS